MLLHFPKIITNDPGYETGCLYFLTIKPKLCKKVYFRALRSGRGLF